MSKFALGQVVTTPTAQKVVSPEEMTLALLRHAAGDWGKLDPDDAHANDEALKEGSRILSSYRTFTGEKFWIITEADRSVTTILLPEDY